MDEQQPATASVHHFSKVEEQNSDKKIPMVQEQNSDKTIPMVEEQNVNEPITEEQKQNLFLFEIGAKVQQGTATKVFTY